MGDDKQRDRNNDGSTTVVDTKNTDSPTEMEIEDRRKRRQDEKLYVTGRVSESCRYIGFGLVAIFYTIVTSSEEFPKNLWDNHGWLVQVFGAFGALTVFFDYIQYLAGDFAARAALRRLNEGQSTLLYNDKWLSYRLRNTAYLAKQLSCLGGALVLIYIMTKSLV